MHLHMISTSSAHDLHPSAACLSGYRRTCQYLRQYGPPVVLADFRIEKVPYRLIGWRGTACRFS